MMGCIGSHLSKLNIFGQTSSSTTAATAATAAAAFTTGSIVPEAQNHRQHHILSPTNSLNGPFSPNTFSGGVGNSAASGISSTTGGSCATAQSTIPINNIFPVLNVDDMGRHVSPGKLEVTETDLILHINTTKNPLTWPLRCLRRYGYENDLFSFESGRRCPTGPGIYAFKCNRAQSLFNLLQAKIQNNPNSTNNAITLPLPTPTSSTASQSFTGESTTQATATAAAGEPNAAVTTNSTNTTPSISPTFDYVNIAENRATATANNNNNNSDLTSDVTLDDNNHPVYMNIDSQNKTTTTGGNKLTKSGRRIISVGRPICNGTAAGIYQQSNDYLNFPCKGPPPGSGSTNPEDSVPTLYTNIIPTLSASAISNSNGNFTSSSSSASNIGQQQQPISEINYAELDLKQIPSSKSSNNPTSNSFRSGSSINKSDKPYALIQPAAGAPASSSATVLLSSTNNNNNSTMNPIPQQQQQQQANSSSSPLEALGYATIDFDRTAALSNVTRSKITLNFSNNFANSDKDDQETTTTTNNSSHSSARKTRHNSTAL